MSSAFSQFAPPRVSPLHTFCKYLLWGAALLLIAACLIFGPNRLYGMLLSREVTGSVVNIMPYGKADGAASDLYLIEIRAEPELIYLAPSNDPQWLLVHAGERVRVRFYPTAPWVSAAGTWQNVVLVTKLANPAPSAANAGEKTSVKPPPSSVHSDIPEEPWEYERFPSPGYIWSNKGVYWLATKLPADLPQRLEAGRFFVEEGLAEFHLESGAKFILEGPAEFEVISDLHCHLHNGKLMADVPDELTDFLLTSPDFAIVPIPPNSASAAKGTKTTTVAKPAKTETLENPGTSPSPPSSEEETKPPADGEEASPEASGTLADAPGSNEHVLEPQTPTPNEAISKERS